MSHYGMPIDSTPAATVRMNAGGSETPYSVSINHQMFPEVTLAAQARLRRCTRLSRDPATCIDRTIDVLTRPHVAGLQVTGVNRFPGYRNWSSHTAFHLHPHPHSHFREGYQPTRVRTMPDDGAARTLDHAHRESYQSQPLARWISDRRGY